MEIVYLLICVLSVTSAKVYPRTGINDVFDGVEGVMYDVPEYEDPDVTLFKLIAKGIMPVYTQRGVIDSKDLAKDNLFRPLMKLSSLVRSLTGFTLIPRDAIKSKDDKPHYQTDDIKKGLDVVITQLQEAKTKLESGNNEIYFDIDKSTLYLENLKHHLYMDLHPISVAVASRKQIGLSDGSSDKGPAILRASLKKYLSSDDSASKYLSFDIPNENPTEKPSSDISADLSYNIGSALVSYSPPKDSIEESSADDHSSDETSDSSSPKDQNSPSSAEQTLNVEASSESPFASRKAMFKYELLRTDMPPFEVIPEKTDMYKVDDGPSSSDADKAEEGDKTLIRKKWSLKLSSTI